MGCLNAKFQKSSYLSFRVGIDDKEDQISELKSSTDGIDGDNKHHTIRYEGEAVPHAYEAVEKGV